MFQLYGGKVSKLKKHMKEYNYSDELNKMATAITTELDHTSKQNDGDDIKLRAANAIYYQLLTPFKAVDRVDIEFSKDTRGAIHVTFPPRLAILFGQWTTTDQELIDNLKMLENIAHKHAKNKNNTNNNNPNMVH